MPRKRSTQKKSKKDVWKDVFGLPTIEDYFEREFPDLLGTNKKASSKKKSSKKSSSRRSSSSRKKR